MKIHTITCISDEFTEEEIQFTEQFAIDALTPVKSLLERFGSEDSGVVLYLKSDVVNFMPVGYTPAIKSIIRKKLLEA